MKKKTFLFILIMAVSIMGFNFNVFADSAKAPTVKLSSPSAQALLVKTTSSAKHDGFQIRYSKNEDFNSSKSKKVKTSKALSKKLTGLSGGRTYYVEVRSYKGKAYSQWSKVKSIYVKPSKDTVYINAWKINLETSKKSTNKWSKDPKNYTLAYMTPVKVSGSIGPYKTKQWVKLKYNGKTYYTYVDPSNVKDPFTKTRHEFTASAYTKYCKSDLQRQIVERAIMIYDAGFVKSYDRGHSTYRIEMGDEFYSADCINFARMIINPILGSNSGIPVRPEDVWSAGKEAYGNLKAVIMGTSTENNIVARELDKTKLQPGDILCFDEVSSDSRPKEDGVDHVGVYLGNGDYIQCTGTIPGSSNGGVIISPLKGKDAKRFIGAVRYVE